MQIYEMLGFLGCNFHQAKHGHWQNNRNLVAGAKKSKNALSAHTLC